MSKTHTKAFAGLQQAALGSALALSIGLIGTLSAWADGELTLKNVTVDGNKQLVVQFVTGQGAPQSPKMMEMPAPNHQLLIDFSGVSLDDSSVPSGDQLTKQLVGSMPGVRAARVAVLPNTDSPTVRLALDLDADLVIKPSISALQDGAAIISLGEDYGGPAKTAQAATSAPTPGAAPAAAAAAAPDALNDPAAAYEEYYRKFLAQKQLTTKQQVDQSWGPRKGTLEEAKSVKGLKIIGTPVDAPALRDIAEDASASASAAPAPGGRKKVQVAAAAPAAVTEAPAEPAAAVEEVKTAAAPATAAPAAEAEEVKTAAVESAAGQEAMSAAEEVPVKKAAAAAETAAAREEASAQAQPDMVAGGESAAAAEPQKVATAAVPADVAPVRPPAHVLRKPVAKPNAAEVESTAAAEADAGAASAASPGSAEPSAAESMSADGGPVEGAETTKHKASRLYNEAYKSHVKGHVAQAILLYKEALKANPELGEAHSNLGLAYNQQHNYASALTEFHKALAINPRDAITYNGVGAALRAEHDMPAAIKNWETAVKIDPRLAVAHYNLGTAYEAESDYDRALVSYENAVKNDQRMGEAFFRMGIIMQKRHRLQDAKAHYKQALSVAGDSEIAAEAREKIAAIDKLAK